MSEAGGIDWPAAYARLERARRALEGGLTPEAETRVLRQRAERLARRTPPAPQASEPLDLLAISLAGERYAMETAYVLEVAAYRDPTPLPRTPPFVLGVLNHRGQVLALLDLRRLLDLGGADAPQQGRIVVVEVGSLSFGIRADSVAGTLRVDSRELAPLPASRGRGRAAFLRGVTREALAVLDLELLARDPRIAVNDEAV